VPDVRNHVQGYGGSFSGVWALGGSKDNIVYQFVIGKGISNYYNDNFGLGSDVGFDATGTLVAAPSGSGASDINTIDEDLPVHIPPTICGSTYRR
jgi:hypothetical protein